MLSVRGFGLSAALTLTERRKCAPQCNEASIVELTETWFIVHNVADGNETLSYYPSAIVKLQLKGHCTATRRRRLARK